MPSVSLVTAVNDISSAAQGFAGTIIDVSARVSTRANALVAVVHTLAQPITKVVWDVCGAEPQSMVCAAVFDDGQASPAQIAVFHLSNPTVGEHVLRAYCSGTAGGRTIGSYALRGVLDETPLGSFVDARGSGAVGLSAQVASTANGLVIDANTWGGAANTSTNHSLTPEDGQTQSYNRRPAGNTGIVNAGSYQTGEVSTRMSWAETIGGASQFLHVAFNVVATTATANVIGKTSLMSLGMGT